MVQQIDDQKLDDLGRANSCLLLHGFRASRIDEISHGTIYYLLFVELLQGIEQKSI